MSSEYENGKQCHPFKPNETQSSAKVESPRQLHIHTLAVISDFRVRCLYLVFRVEGHILFSSLILLCDGREGC